MSWVLKLMILKKEFLLGKMDEEEYPFPEDKPKKTEINLDCICPERTCPRHGNCKACQEFHHKRGELSYCQK